MPANQTRLQYLYHRFISDEATAEELQEFWRLMQAVPEDDSVKDAVFHLYSEPVPPNIESKDWTVFAHRITPKAPPPQIAQTWWWAAAAIILLAFGIALIKFYGEKPAAQPKVAVVMQPQDVAAPDASRATITLANGKIIYLDSAGTGTLVRQQNVKLEKTSGGAVAYHVGRAAYSGELVYNTLHNPRGSKVITIRLSDGSKIWLNAATSVTYPIAFNALERRVFISGEAYLEVAHDASRKFFVESKGITTEVLGTHFNVNAYQDEEAVQITLLQGSVKVNDMEGGSFTIIPGEQASKKGSGKIRTAAVDVEEVVAWKNDRFYFNETGIRDIMKKVSRWYNVDVQYNGNMNGLSFGGTMSRQKNLSELLKRLEATKALHFKLAGKTLLVSKN